MDIDEINVCMKYAFGYQKLMIIRLKTHFPKITKEELIEKLEQRKTWSLWLVFFRSKFSEVCYRLICQEANDETITLFMEQLQQIQFNLHETDSVFNQKYDKLCQETIERIHECINGLKELNEKSQMSYQVMKLFYESKRITQHFDSVKLYDDLRFEESNLINPNIWQQECENDKLDLLTKLKTFIYENIDSLSASNLKTLRTIMYNQNLEQVDNQLILDLMEVFKEKQQQTDEK